MALNQFLMGTKVQILPVSVLNRLNLPGEQGESGHVGKPDKDSYHR